MTLSKLTSSVILIIAIGFILYIGMDLLVPFVLAFIIWFLIKGIRATLQRINWVRNILPQAILSLVAGVIIFAIMGGIVKLLSVNIHTITKSVSSYDGNLSTYISTAGTFLGIDLSTELQSFLGNLDISSIIMQVASSLTTIFGNAFMILVYTIFLLIEEYIFAQKLSSAFEKTNKLEQIKDIMTSVNLSISNYLSLKTLVSLLTGFLSYWALLIIGVDAPFFWAFIIFLLNYIPAIGSIIATLFPTAFAILQFGDVTHALWVLAIVGAIQVIIGNIVEPRVMGNSLNISPLVVILSLSFWGALWGIVGMMLSVPITVILIIILSEIPSTQPIAIMLTARGRLGKNNPDAHNK